MVVHTAFVPPPVIASTCSFMWAPLVGGIFLILLACGCCGRNFCLPLCGLGEIAMLCNVNPLAANRREGFFNVGNCGGIFMFCSGVLFIIYASTCSTPVMVIAWIFLIPSLLPLCCMPLARPAATPRLTIKTPAAVPAIAQEFEPKFTPQAVPQIVDAVRPLSARSPQIGVQETWNPQAVVREEVTPGLRTMLRPVVLHSLL